VRARAPAFKSRQRHALSSQQLDQPDQGQADQRTRIITLEAFEQGDPIAFRLEAAGAVEGLLAVDVARDLLRAEGAEVDVEPLAQGV